MTPKNWQKVLGAAALMLACVVVTPSHAGVSDAWISAKIKMALLDSPQVSGIPIDVDTDNGYVTIHGRVPTESEKKEAERIARAGDGVKSVRNLIQVVPESRRKAVERSDEQIRKDVSDGLEAEKALGNSSIHVKSVTQGVVLLDGKAASLSDHLTALEIASGMPGVKRVASEVQSPDRFADRELWKDDAPGQAMSGNAVTDAWITTQTKLKFMTDADVPAWDINVDTHRGVVTLFGTVPSAASSEKAEQLTRQVDGVRDVQRELRVVPPAKKNSAVANDGDLASAIRERLNGAKFDGAHLAVEVKASVARLTGTVENPGDRYAAITLAARTPGVLRVVNDVRVESGQTSQR